MERGDKSPAPEHAVHVILGRAARALAAVAQRPVAIGRVGDLGGQELPARQRRAERAPLQQRDAGITGYRIYNRGGSPVLPQEDVLATRFVVPMAGNAAALGLNALSGPGRDAVQRARRLDRPVASPAFRLVQETGDPE